MIDGLKESIKDDFFRNLINDVYNIKIELNVINDPSKQLNILFDNVFDTCDKIIQFCEADYCGKPAINPTNLKDIYHQYKNSYDDIAEKLDSQPSGRLPKYAINQAYCHTAPSENKIKHFDATLCWKERDIIVKNSISRLDFANEVNKHYPWVNYKYCYDRSIYIKYFFGLEFSEDARDDIKYEQLRLLLILIECETKFDVELASLLKASIYRFQSHIDSRYKEAIRFIQKSILTYRRPPIQNVTIDSIIEFTLFVSKLRNLVWTLPEKAIASIDIKKPSYEQDYMIKDNIYQLILYTTSENVLDSYIFISDTDMPAYAYVHFMSLSIIDKKNLMLSYVKQPKILRIMNELYAFFCDPLIASESNLGPDKLLKLSECKNFLHDNQYNIIAHTFHKTVSLSTKKKFQRNISNYLRFIHIYLVCFHNNTNNINKNDFLLLITLYELLREDSIQIPIQIGYSNDHSDRKCWQINKVMDLIIPEFDDTNLLKSDVAIANAKCYSAYSWITEVMNAIINHHDARLYILRCNAISALSTFFLAEVSPIADHAGKYGHGDFAKTVEDTIVPLALRQHIYNKINDIK